MRFLPVFLDLQSGVVLLVGAGDLVRAKLRLLTSAGSRVRWFAIDGNYDVAGLEDSEAARIEFAKGDPLTADLSGVLAVLCAGAGDIGVAMSVRAKAVGLPVNVMDDLAHSTFIFPAIVDRGDVVVAVGTGGASPVVWHSAVTGMMPATCCSRMRSTLATRRLLINLVSVLFIALSATRSEITMPTESRLMRVTAISSSINVTPDCDGRLIAAVPLR